MPYGAWESTDVSGVFSLGTGISGTLTMGFGNLRLLSYLIQPLQKHFRRPQILEKRGRYLLG